MSETTTASARSAVEQTASAVHALDHASAPVVTCPDCGAGADTLSWYAADPSNRRAAAAYCAKKKGGCGLRFQVKSDGTIGARRTYQQQLDHIERWRWAEPATCEICGHPTRRDQKMCKECRTFAPPYPCRCGVRWKHTHVIVQTCVYCHDKFVAKHPRTNNPKRQPRQTCSDYCHRKLDAQKRRQTARKYKNGKRSPRKPRKDQTHSETINWSRRLLRIARQQRHRCAHCRQPLDYTSHRTKHSATLDHIQPLNPTDGTTPGDDTDTNLQVLCRSCNAAKGNRPTPNQQLRLA